MVLLQIIDMSAPAFRVCPLHVHFRRRRFVVCYGIILNRALFARFAAPQFVPLVVGQSVVVDILHYPDNARFVRSAILTIEGVSLYGKIVIVIGFGDAMVESHDDIAAESAKRYEIPIG